KWPAPAQSPVLSPPHSGGCPRPRLSTAKLREAREVEAPEPLTVKPYQRKKMLRRPDTNKIRFHDLRRFTSHYTTKTPRALAPPRRAPHSNLFQLSQPPPERSDCSLDPPFDFSNYGKLHCYPSEAKSAQSSVLSTQSGATRVNSAQGTQAKPAPSRPLAV